MPCPANVLDVIYTIYLAQKGAVILSGVARAFALREAPGYTVEESLFDV